MEENSHSLVVPLDSHQELTKWAFGRIQPPFCLVLGLAHTAPVSTGHREYIVSKEDYSAQETQTKGEVVSSCLGEVGRGWEKGLALGHSCRVHPHPFSNHIPSS